MKLSGFVKLPLAIVAVAGLLAGGCATPVSAPPPTAKAQQQSITPAQALAKLEQGNARYVAGRPYHRDWAQQRSVTAGGQYPHTIILSCVDSRASGEIIFDQGLGDVFNARIAGNILNDDILGSMEFACKIAGAKLIAVIGHTHCGAVKGACAGAQLGHLTGLLEHIQPSVAEVKTSMPEAKSGDAKFVEAVAEQNVHLVVKQIRERSPVLRELIDSGSVGVVGGIYDLDTGKVQFFKP